MYLFYFEPEALTCPRRPVSRGPDVPEKTGLPSTAPLTFTSDTLTVCCVLVMLSAYWGSNGTGDICHIIQNPAMDTQTMYSPVFTRNVWLSLLGIFSRKHSTKSWPLLVDKWVARANAARAMQAIASYHCRRVCGK